jgi:hypothetical protein
MAHRYYGGLFNLYNFEEESLMNYQFTGLNAQYDAQRNITGFLLQFNGRNDSTGEYLNGSVKITMEQFTAAGGNVEQINALIAPAVQALAGGTQA